VTWTFIWLMVVLKLPIAALLYIVWWAIRAEPDPAAGEDDGGIRPDPERGPRPPRRPRRGPRHAVPVPAAPPRVRAPAVAREPAAPHR